MRVIIRPATDTLNIQRFQFFSFASNLRSWSECTVTTEIVRERDTTLLTRSAASFSRRAFISLLRSTTRQRPCASCLHYVDPPHTLLQTCFDNTRSRPHQPVRLCIGGFPPQYAGLARGNRPDIGTNLLPSRYQSDLVSSIACFSVVLLHLQFIKPVCFMARLCFVLRTVVLTRVTIPVEYG